MGRIRLKERDSPSGTEIGIKIVFIVYARTREYAGSGFLIIPVRAGRYILPVFQEKVSFSL